MSDAPRWLEQLADGSLDDVKEVEIEPLELVSGRLVACDPLVFLRGAEAFAKTVEPGTYKVVLGRVEDGDTAYALVRLSKRKRKIARWEVARCPGEEEVEGWPGYSVDSGVGGFVDAATIEAFLKEEDAIEEKVAAKIAEDDVDLSDSLAYAKAFERHRASAGPDRLADVQSDVRDKGWAAVELGPDAEGNIVAFRAGTGDGVYATFWGLDAKGQPVCAVTDFGFFAEDDDELGDDDDLDSFEDDLDDLDLGDDDALPVTASDLAGLEALAAALGATKPEPEEFQGPSPLFLQTRDLITKWVKTEKIELEPDVNLDTFAEAFLEKLVSLQGHRHPGAHIAEWLLERGEVADVFASDDELERDLTG